MPLVAMGDLAFLRHPQASDAREFLFLMKASREIHRPWVYPPATEEAFARYVEQSQSDRFLGCLICHSRSGEIFGVANLSEIVRGGFQNAYLGFYASYNRSGKGRIREGVALLVNHAFRKLKLHRVEANVQPENQRSLAFIQSLLTKSYGQLIGQIGLLLLQACVLGFKFLLA